jgi:hypothetical protein
VSNTRSFLTSAVIATAILVTFGTLCSFAKQEVLVSANVAEVGNGYRTSELRGEPVWNDRNQRIGRITEIVIGRDEVPFAVLEVGGFIGLGAHMVAVPFKALKIDEPGRRIVLPGATALSAQEFSRVQVSQLAEAATLLQGDGRVSMRRHGRDRYRVAWSIGDRIISDCSATRVLDPFSNSSNN